MAILDLPSSILVFSRLVSRVLDQLLQRLGKNLDILRPRAVAHQADAPDLAFERPQPGADLDIEIVIKPLAHFAVIDAFGNFDRIDHRRTNRFGYRRFELEFAHFAHESFVHWVARPGCLQSFFEHDA